MNSREDLERKPVINLLTAPGISRQGTGEKILRAVTAGMEEESVPWMESEEGAATAQELALQGARRSQLGVGIGIGADLSVAVYFHRADNALPLFTISGPCVSETTARLLGTNAARLVKKVPFKELGVFTNGSREGGQI